MILLHFQHLQTHRGSTPNHKNTQYPLHWQAKPSQGSQQAKPTKARPSQTSQLAKPTQAKPSKARPTSKPSPAQRSQTNQQASWCQCCWVRAPMSLRLGPPTQMRIATTNSEYQQQTNSEVNQYKLRNHTLQTQKPIINSAAIMLSHYKLRSHTTQTYNYWQAKQHQASNKHSQDMRRQASQLVKPS